MSTSTSDSSFMAATAVADTAAAQATVAGAADATTPVAGATLAAGATHICELPLRWGDSDALNHLNNTLYFRLMEEARMQILYGADLRLPADDGPILAHASCDFLRPLTYPATVRVTHTLTRIGRSSMEFELVLDKVGEEGGGPYARGRNVLVWMDYVANRSAPWPATTLAALARVLAAPAAGIAD